MVVREYLESQGVDLSRFTNSFFNPCKVRRKELKLPGNVQYEYKCVEPKKIYKSYITYIYTKNVCIYMKTRNSKKLYF